MNINDLIEEEIKSLETQKYLRTTALIELIIEKLNIKIDNDEVNKKVKEYKDIVRKKKLNKIKEIRKNDGWTDFFNF